MPFGNNPAHEPLINRFVAARTSVARVIEEPAAEFSAAEFSAAEFSACPVIGNATILKYRENLKKQDSCGRLDAYIRVQTTSKTKGKSST